MLNHKGHQEATESTENNKCLINSINRCELWVYSVTLVIKLIDAHLRRIDHKSNYIKQV